MAQGAAFHVGRRPTGQSQSVPLKIRDKSRPMRALVPASLRQREVGIAALLTVLMWITALLLWSAQDIVEGSPFPWPYRRLLIEILVVGLSFSALLASIIVGVRPLQPLLRTSVTALAAIVIAILHGWVDAHQLAHMRAEINASVAPIMTLFVSGLMPFLLIYGLYAAALGLMLGAMTARRRDVQLAEARSAAQQAQLAALRFQLNPHFLFNTLNAISSLIVTHRNADAEAMTMRLAEFLRITLETDPEATVTLDEELATTQCYLDIEKARFGARLNVVFECPAALLDAHVPSLLLQPIIENSIKYAVAPARHKVTISVSAAQISDRLRLLIEDDGQQAFGNRPSGSTGLGLANVGQRLRTFYGDEAALEARATDRGFAVALTMPLRLAPIAKAAE